MPTATFFHLPEEKRRRLMDAAWAEFTHVPFADASINKIIQTAGIPRGSFYQYFEDKRDLFDYLVRPVQQYFFDLARQEVEAVHGDLSAAPLRIYDRFFWPEARHDRELARCIQVVQRNPDSEFYAMLDAPDSTLRSITAIVDTTSLMRGDSEYLQEVFHLFVFTTACAIFNTLNCPEKSGEYRRQLQTRVDILLRGCCVQS